MKACLALVLVAVLGCSSDPSGGSVEGPKIFDTMCTSCHGRLGKPTEAMVAQLNVRDLTSPELRAKVTPALVENQVRKGSKNKLMPAFEGAMTDVQIKAVAAYVASPAFLERR